MHRQIPQPPNSQICISRTHLEDVDLDTGNARGEEEGSEAEGTTEGSRLGAATDELAQGSNGVVRHSLLSRPGMFSLPGPSIYQCEGEGLKPIGLPEWPGPSAIANCFAPNPSAASLAISKERTNKNNLQPHAHLAGEAMEVGLVVVTRTLESAPSFTHQDIFVLLKRKFVRGLLQLHRIVSVHATGTYLGPKALRNSAARKGVCKKQRQSAGPSRPENVQGASEVPPNRVLIRT